VTVKARLGTRWHSIERQLPLLIAGLLLVTVFAFAWGAYQRVKHVLLTAAGQRLQGTSLTLNFLFADGARRYIARVDSVASDPVIAAYLATGRASPDVRRHLADGWMGDAAPRARIELLRPDGTVATDTARGGPIPQSAWASQIVIAGGPVAASPHVSPFRAIGDSTYSEAIVPVHAPVSGDRGTLADSAQGTRIIGYVADLRYTTTQNGQAVRDLIGSHARILIGSPGENAWTDLDRRQPPPPGVQPFNQAAILTGSTGQEVVAVESRVPGVPWLLWIEQPTVTILAPMRALLLELAEVAGIIVLVGAGAGWLLSRRITSPIVSLTAVAQRIASSDQAPVLADNADEVTLLGDAIRRMAGRVRDSLTTAETARADAEALAGQLQRRSEELEQQTREAHALASELEQQFEEAQSLSEELEQSNEQLQESANDADASRRALGDIVESITDAFVAYDRDWRITFINRRAQEYFRQLGVTATEFEGQNVWTFFPESRGTIVEHEMRRTMEKRVTVAFETEVGGNHWLAIRAYPAGDGGVTAVWTDITESKRATIANTFLAEASRLLSASLDVHASLRDVARAAVPTVCDWCGVDLVSDPRSTEWPPVLTRLGIAHRDPSLVAFAAEYQERHPIDWDARGGIATVLRTGEPQLVPAVTDDMVAAVARSDAHLADLRRFGFRSVLLAPMTARGRTLGVFSFAMADSGRLFDARDLELMRNLADRAAIAVDNAWLFHEADGARAIAEAANKAKLDFLASMSHELRTPLNAIAGYVQLLDMQVAGPVLEEQRRFLSRIRRAQDLLLGRINDMLNFVKIDSGTLVYTLRPVLLHEILTGLDIMIQPQLTDRGLTYQYVPADPSIVVRADGEKLEQILLNLLSNATKFTPRGGRITLAAVRHGSRAEITVSDTGVGIPVDRLAAIFEPFVQLDPSLTRERDGTGLGLAISRDLARAMGGEVTVTSAPGAGSTFTLVVPAYTAAPDTPRTTEPAVGAAP
jgi:PAS domain S-box-containing protein